MKIKEHFTCIIKGDVIVLERSLYLNIYIIYYDKIFKLYTEECFVTI